VPLLVIRLTIPSIDEEDFQAVRDVLSTGYLVQGPRVAAFEANLAEYIGVPHAVAVSSGTAALHLSLLALAVRPNDLVVTTAYSFPATANVVELCGAEPVFVDICPDTFNLDPHSLRQTLKPLMASRKTARRVRAIMPVHAFGQLADMPAIQAVAAQYGVPVVEDAACALGARLADRQAGTWGVLGCFSFHPRKAITTGEGGLIVTADPSLARQLRTLRSHGQASDAPAPDFILPGFNYRMTEFQAALGCVQLGKLDRIVARRRSLAESYSRLLRESGFQTPVVPEGSEPVFQSYVVLVPEALAQHRDACIRYLRERGVEATIGTWHIPMTTYFRTHYGYKVGSFPVTDGVFARSVTLPLHEQLQDSEQEQVVNALRSWTTVQTEKGGP
jgi:dTDP-4-amino-4,6-dideoxygalactose transaminase